MARKKTTDAAVVGRVSQDPGVMERFQQYKSWFSMEWAKQEANRFQMATDEDYYDSIQWTPEEAREVRKRGQNPIVYNEIKPTIDWLIGTQRRMRRDFKVLARNSASKEAYEDAQIKTSLLKYLDDVNRSPFVRSDAFDDKVKAGVGWIEIGISSDPEEELIYTRFESWRNMLHDSLAPTRDVNTGRYLFRFREVDLDVAQAYFPDKALELERASNAGMDADIDDSGWTGTFPSIGMLGSANMPAKYIQFNNDAWTSNPRKRVLLIECWCKRPTTEQTGMGTPGLTKMKMHVTIMTKLETILEAPSPYKHNKFPFVPNWCYRRKGDGAPYGAARSIRGPQDGLNKRQSKAQFEAASNQLRVEEGAIDDEVMDLEEIRDEVNSPDGIAVFANGALSGGKVQQHERKADMRAQMELGNVDRAMIRSASGVSDENRGVSTNVIAAKGILAKQEQGGLLTAEIFDNDLLAHQQEGELIIALIEQFYTEEKTFSVTGERFKLDYHTINQTDPVTGQKINDVTRHKASFVIGEAPWRQTLAEAAFESTMEVMTKLAPAAPQVVIAILDLLFEWTDLPNKHTIIQRIRSVTGQGDPDKEETPEQIAEKQKKAQLAQAQFEAELAGLKATVAEAQAKGVKLDAEAMAKRLETVYMSAQAAQVALQVPGSMVVADQLLQSVGFKDQSGDGTGAQVPEQAAPPQPMPVEQPPQPGAAAPEQLPQLQQADGAMQGIETPAPDGVITPEGPQ